MNYVNILKWILCFINLFFFLQGSAQLFGGHIKPNRNLTNLYPPNSIFCNGPTLVIDVTNPATGRTWMDRNLGASQAATSSTDSLAYGDLYQWGRRSDGHQCRNSATTSTLGSTDTPANSNFILAPNSPNDWRSPQNNNLWQGVNGVNNPCPSGYRLPTATELTNERLSWSSLNAIGAFNSPLKLTMPGSRNNSVGSFNDVGTYGYYWSSTFVGSNSELLYFNLSNAIITTLSRGRGNSVRCIKELVASLGALNCSSATTTGTIIEGQSLSGVSSSVPYTGGNGGYYAAQSVSSSGVSGLTASLAAGLLATGSGSLVYTITGTPATAGTASFALTVGGQSCTLNLTVLPPQPPYPPNSVFCNGPTIVIDVTNPATGKTWMDRNLGASQAATSSTDSLAYGDLYQWGRRADGHQCRNSATTTTLSSTDTPPHGSFILAPNSPFDWRSPQNTNLWQGVNGVNNPCPSGYRLPTESELNAERLSWSQNNSAGAFASPLSLPMAGHRGSSSGSLLDVGTEGYYWSSTVSSASSRSLLFVSSNAFMFTYNRANGFSVRCIKELVASLGALNCSSATTTGNIIEGQSLSGVSSSVPYTGGNGATHNGQTVSSTGVTGLTATLAAGTFANGAGSLTYTISGTPATSGTASFALNIGGQSCTLNVTVIPPQPPYPANSVFCNGPTLVIDVTNPATGRTWMDRNLGASQAATSSTDAASYGDLYQWGRRSDGHQCRNSATTSTLSSTDTPPHGNFILPPNSPNDWRSPQNANLWQGVNGINNPCPSGYRIPTETELNAERTSWSSNNAAGAFASPLKLPLAGYRDLSNGSLNFVGTYGYYWSSTFVSPSSRYLNFNSSNANMTAANRAYGRSVRCLKD